MKKHLFVSIFAALSFSLTPAMAQYSKFQPTLEQFVGSLQQINRHIEDYDYDAAYQQYNNALILYQRALNYASRSETDTAEDVWQINQALQVNLARAALDLGHRFHDSKQYDKAIAVYTKAHDVSPFFPIFIFERGYAYYMQGNHAQAAADFYEAKRLNAYPARRKLVNPMQSNDFLMGDPLEIKAKSNAYLLNMGYTNRYPLEKNMSTQQPTSLAVMPGVGAHIQQKDKQKSVYFGMSEEDLTADFVFPEQKFEPQDFNGKQVYAAQFDGILASFYAEGDLLRGLEIQTPGAQVSLLGKTTRIGDHARQVLAHFGRGFAFEKYPNNLPVYPDIKEFISYDELGLTFGLSFDDHVALISILALDDALLHNNLWVDTTLLNPEILRTLNDQSGE